MKGRRVEEVQRRRRTDGTGIKEGRIRTLQVTSQMQEQRSEGQTGRRGDQVSLHQPRAEKLPASDVPEAWWDIGSESISLPSNGSST